jgi:uncharacterized protein YggU (UPF0235/DUF167 family)
MIITVLAKPRSRKEFVRKIDDTTYTVAVHAAPVKGAANHSIRELLAEYFQVSPSMITLMGGSKIRKKLFEIPDIL